MYTGPLNLIYECRLTIVAKRTASDSHRGANNQIIDYSISCLVYKKSENGESCLVPHKSSDDVFKCLHNPKIFSLL